MKKILIGSVFLSFFFFLSSGFCEAKPKNCQGKLGRNQPITQFNGTVLDFGNLLIPPEYTGVDFLLNTPAWKTRHNIKQLSCTIQFVAGAAPISKSAVRVGKQLVSDVRIFRSGRIDFDFSNIETGEARGRLECKPVENDPKREVMNFDASSVYATSLLAIFTQGNISCSIPNLEHIQQMKMPVTPQPNNTNQPVAI